MIDALLSLACILAAFLLKAAVMAVFYWAVLKVCQACGWGNPFQ